MHIVLSDWVRQQKGALGQIDFRATMWLRPAGASIVQRDGDACIAHEWDLLDVRTHTQRTPLTTQRALLWRFLGLADASDAKTCRFALNYGGLDVTDFGAPVAAVPWVSASSMVRERVSWYRYYSRLAATVLRLAASLAEQRDKRRVVIATDDVLTLREHNAHWTMLRQAIEEAQRPRLSGELIELPPNAEEWLIEKEQQPPSLRELRRKIGMTEPSTPPASEYPGETLTWPVRDVERAVETTLRWWLAVSWIHPTIRREGGAWVEHQSCGNAWGALGLSLRTVLLQGQHAATCHHCGRAVTRSRRPAAGRRAWCPENPDCRRAKARTDKQEQRARA